MKTCPLYYNPSAPPFDTTRKKFRIQFMASSTYGRSNLALLLDRYSNMFVSPKMTLSYRKLCVACCTSAISSGLLLQANLVLSFAA